VTNKGNCDAGRNSKTVCSIVSPSTLQKPFVGLLQRRLLRPVSQFFPPTTDVGISQFYLHTHTFIRNRNEPYLPLPSQQQLVLIYRPRRDGRLSRPWDRQSLWLPLRSNGIPEKILQLIEDLYNNTFSCVRVDGELYLHGLRPPLEFDRAVLYPWTFSGTRGLDHEPCCP